MRSVGQKSGAMVLCVRYLSDFLGGMIFMKMKRMSLILLVLVIVLGCVACSNTPTDEEIIVTETEEIEIIDATEILSNVWSEIDTGDLEVMGGHFSEPVMGSPAKYDLIQAQDLMSMYCVPENQISVIDDVATVIDLYNAARFTASAFHLTNVESQESFIVEMKQQIEQNEWHGEKPEKILVLGIGDEYVVAVYGREQIVDAFEIILQKIYLK